MKRVDLRRNSLYIRIFLVVFFLLPGPAVRAGEAGKSPRDYEGDLHKAARLTLSLRIAEAKGKKAAQTYFRSLLRQSKRKRFSENPSRKSGFRKPH